MSVRKSRFLIGRYELYPKDNPVQYLVGFKIICDFNAREGYVEVGLPLEAAQGLTEHEVCEAAWRHGKAQLQEEIQRLESIPSVLGADFIPPDE